MTSAFDWSPGGCCCESQSRWYTIWSSSSSQLGGVQALDRADNCFVRTTNLWDHRALAQGGTRQPPLQQNETCPTSWDDEAKWRIEKHDLVTNEAVNVLFYWGFCPFPFNSDKVWVTFQKKNDTPFPSGTVRKYIGLIDADSRRLLWHQQMPYLNDGIVIPGPGIIADALHSMIMGGGTGVGINRIQQSYLGDSSPFVVLNVPTPIAGSGSDSNLLLVMNRLNPSTGQVVLDPVDGFYPLECFDYNAAGVLSRTVCQRGAHTIVGDIPVREFPLFLKGDGTMKIVERLAPALYKRGVGITYTARFWRDPDSSPDGVSGIQIETRLPLVYTAEIGDVSITSLGLEITGATTVRTSSQPLRWAWFDASPTHWVGVLTETGAFGSNTVLHHLYIDGVLIKTITVPTTPSLGFNGVFGVAHVCHPHEEAGIGDGWVAVPTRIYTTPPGPGNQGVLEDPNNPYRLVFYKNGVERWRTGKAAQMPAVGASSDRWVYASAVHSLTSDFGPLYPPGFTGPGGFTRHQICQFRHDGSAQVPGTAFLMNNNLPNPLGTFDFNQDLTPPLEPHILGSAQQRNVVMRESSLPATFPAEWPFPS